MNLVRPTLRIATVACLAALVGCAGLAPGVGRPLPGGDGGIGPWAGSGVEFSQPLAAANAGTAVTGKPEVVRGQTPPGYDAFANPSAQPTGAAYPPPGTSPTAGAYPNSGAYNLGGSPQNVSPNTGGVNPTNTVPPAYARPAPQYNSGPTYQTAQTPPGYYPPPGAFNQGPPANGFAQGPAGNLPPPPGYNAGQTFGPPPYALPPPGGFPPGALPPGAQPPLGGPLGLPGNFADIDAFVQEARTGRIMFGVGVNSQAGVTGQFVIDERNFDITRIPTSFSDFVNGSAFRGAGQGFRLEALPGNLVQRYLFSFSEPYLFDSLISLNVSGFYYQRIYNDWNEQRLGGRVSLGRWLTPNLSLSAALRAEQVQVLNPRVLGVPELDAVLGKSNLYSGRISLAHDTRDVPFAPTEGRYLELSVEQAFGTYVFPRGEVDWRRYFLLRERPDGSGRHTLSTSMKLGFTGSQTPIYENFFAGGYSTLRGFYFRKASPNVGGVYVGGEFQMLGSVEYMFPITADDMFKGVAFVDYGTVESQIAIHGENFRVAPGLGLRISVPMLGPAPLAFDFAVPVHRAPTDQIQIFSFFMGLNR